MSNEDRSGRRRSRSQRFREGISLQRIALYTVLFGMIGFYLAPLESGLMTSIKSTEAFASTTPFAPPGPGGFTFEPWLLAWESLQESLFNLRGSLANSLFFALPATLLSATLGSFAAYGLTKVSWRGQIAVFALLIAGVFIPYQAVLVPLRQFWSFVDIASMLAGVPVLEPRADLIELTITHTAYGIPICTVLFRAYYQTLDDDMLEAARIDGASITGIYRRIVLPLSVPMFAVTLIYQFTQIWNDLLFALVIVQSSEFFVVTQELNALQGALVQEYNIQMAGAFIAALPTLIVYIVFGKQFAEGVAGGGT
jgi:glucose/mannose transport system permease protein